jgi:hypothetical protein
VPSVLARTAGAATTAPATRSAGLVGFGSSGSSGGSLGPRHAAGSVPTAAAAAPLGAPTWLDDNGDADGGTTRIAHLGDVVAVPVSRLDAGAGASAGAGEGGGDGGADTRRPRFGRRAG